MLVGQIAAAGTMMMMSGALDANAFKRADLSNAAYLPPPESLPWEGVLHKHYFDTGTTKLRVEPSFTLLESPDPLTGHPEAWLTMGLNSCYDGAGLKEKGRLPCNAVFVVDVSGSMGSSFAGGSGGSKLDAAKAALLGMVDLLQRDDAVALLAFDEKCEVEVPLARLGDPDMVEKFRAGVERLECRGGTNFMAGFTKAMEVIDDAQASLLAAPVAWTPRVQTELPPAARGGAVFLAAVLRRTARLPGDCSSHVLGFLGLPDVAAHGTAAAAMPGNACRKAFAETRVFFMTDMNINQGTRDGGALCNAIEEAAREQGVLSTVVGIGIDFDVKLTDRLARVRGANYFTVHTTEEFIQQLTEELGYMMAPLAFDVSVQIDASTGVSTEYVYGAPEPEGSSRPAGTLCRVNSFFPSPTDANGQTKGSLIICRLSGLPPAGHLTLVTGYTPRSGGADVELRREVRLLSTESAPSAALKGIVLVRYVNALRCYLADMQRLPPAASTALVSGIAHPPSGGMAEEAGGDRKSLAAGYLDVFERLGNEMADAQQKLVQLEDRDADLGEWQEQLKKTVAGATRIAADPDADDAN